MKYKKIALLLVLAVTLVGFPVAAQAGPGDWSYDDTRRAGSSEFWDEHGFVGGGFATAGNAIKDTFEGLFGGLGGESEDIVSFINFEGGLAPPTGEGLSDTLKTGKDKETGEVSFRIFVVKTVNFILGFLGLVAFIVVVYGGFLYVTSAGNEEQSTKGKKAITYAAVGILIIIGSFGFVNTLLRSVGEGEEERAVGGGADGGGRGSGQEGTNIDQQSIYSLSANAVNTTLRDFAGAFKNLVAIKSIIKTVSGLPAPKGLSENRSYLNAVSNAMNEIKNNTNSLSKANNSARKVLEGFLAKARNFDLAGDKYEDGELKEEFEKDADWKELPTSASQDFRDAIATLVGTEETGDPKGKLGIVQNVLGSNILTATPASYAGRGFQTSKDLQRAFADIDPTKTVGELFNDAVAKIRAARAIGNSEDPASQIDTFAAASKSLFQLSALIKNIEFVFVKIKTTTREGNAPLIVELNGLDSRDPTGDTIADDRYEWNPEGIKTGDADADRITETVAREGQLGKGLDKLLGPERRTSLVPYVECDPASKKKSTIVCTYNHPGTYIVSLKIKSTDESRVAEGQAFLAIKVLPSVARIGMIAKVGDREETLQKYEQDESEKWNAVVDKSEFQVTTSQAKNPGVTFDGSSSQGGDGTGIAKYEWSFGDDSGIKEKAAETHQYKREGRFPLRLEITNANGRKARKIVQIIVASITAAVQPSTTIAEPDELIEFDGSQSKSDQGAISSYTWKLEKLSTETPGKWDDVFDNKNVLTLLSSKDAPTLRVKIKKSGNYRAQLIVADAAGTAEDTEEISVRSRKPRANFSVNFPRQVEKPNVVEFDAGSSFDQDQDPLLFKWIVYDNQGIEMNAGTGYEIESGGIEQKKIRLKFRKLGIFKIHLEVTDDLPENLLQTDIREKDVEIKSIVEGEFDDDQKTSGKLENGVAVFTFKGTVWNANRVEIDFGDEETLEQGVELSGPENAGKFEFTHDYTNAGSYLVNLKAISDEGNGEMSFMKRIYVGGGDAPLAVILAYVDGNEVVLPNPTQENPNPALEMIRKKAVKFDATHSLNMRGAEGGLRFSWHFGDDKRSTGGQVDHSYQDISPEDKPYEVTLTVSEESDAEKKHEATFLVNVVSKKPQVNTLAMEKKTSGDITPVEVKLTAEGAVDPDGRITNYQFWYFDPNETDRKLGVIDTQENSALVTIETAGEENEEHEYLFCVNAQDNENTTSECTELFQQEELPRLTVKNGPNKAPKAEFTVNKNNVRVGESVTFNSSSTDEDGQVKTYIWDIEGDGFQNNDATEQTQLTHRYDRKSPSGGYLVKLKVIDNQNAAGYSKEVPVNVEAKSDAPTADFSFQVQSNPPRRVKFFDASKADSKNNATLSKWMWDFDTSAETGCDAEPKPPHCNGNKADDVDSSDQNPVFDFPAGSQTFQVKLTVEDSDGNIAEPKTALLTLIAGTSGGTGTTTPPSASKVNASLRAITGTGRTSTSEQIPGCSPTSSEQCKRKTVHLPAEAESEEITLFWGETLGDIISYKIDKDVYCDWDARGGPRARDDDVQNPDLTGGTCITANDRLQTANCFTAKYHRYNKTAHPSGKGRFKTMLTVEDREGNVDTDFVEVVFDGQTDPAKVIPDRCERLDSTLTGSLFKNLGTQNTILLGLGAGVIVVLVGFGMAGFLRRGRRRV